MDRIEIVAYVVLAVVLVGATFTVHGVVSGKWTRYEIFHASSTTDCLIVRNGARVAIDCWVVEGEHEHGD